MASKEELVAAITDKGAEIRNAKTSGADKDAVKALVGELLALKSKYQEVTGEEYVAPGEQGSKDKSKAKKKDAAAGGAAAAGGGADERKAKKAERMAQKEQANQKAKASKSAGGGSERAYHAVIELGEAMGRREQRVWLRARVHTTRSVGKGAFLLLRQGLATVQAILFAGKGGAGITKDAVKYASGISRESVVDICGTVKLAPVPVESATQSLIEVHVEEIHVVSAAMARLPLLVEDASRPEGEGEEGGAGGDAAAEGEGEEGGAHVGPRVTASTALDYRWIDLRTPANQSIFRIQSGVCQLFRDYLAARGFVEIHSPKLLGGASEGGSNVFTLDYFGSPACLAQSPQLYKQMTAACGGFEKVFEVGPVFRAENSNTHRHLCEFTGLDLEMTIKEHYYEALELFGELFVHIFDRINERYAAELAAIGQQYPFEPLKYCRPTLRLSYYEGMKLLQDAGYDANPAEDLPTEQEKALGRIVREKFGTDFFIMDKYPLAARPFYTMPCPHDPNLSNSFDIFIRGEEIVSGAQRVHDVDLLIERAKWWQIPLASIGSYLDAFRHGAEPHAGGGIGLERVVMLFLGLKNIRKTSMFPRDPKRIAP
ncbi:aspartyl-tRNA synthetase [Tribonema minus]|uniref:aspartate--tRNA ligase n=1 Tax=Tribonema minus TaxID=303371 RepID=A0A835Z5D4_9STRA|nr:aspartyl-tRNA synthetase [Tribonema minus]